MKERLEHEQNQEEIQEQEQEQEQEEIQEQEQVALFRSRAQPVMQDKFQFLFGCCVQCLRS